MKIMTNTVFLLVIHHPYEASGDVYCDRLPNSTGKEFNRRKVEELERRKGGDGIERK